VAIQWWLQLHEKQLLQKWQGTVTLEALAKAVARV